MKKVLIAVGVIVFVLLAGAGVWIWRTVGGPGEPALLVPSQTVMLASLPDMYRSAIRWPQTSLAQIGFEPEMKTFLEKPLNFLSKSGGGNDASQVLLNLKPRRIFAALVNVSTKKPGVLIGFQFWGSKGDHDAAIARVRAELLQGKPHQEVQTESYQGDEITSALFEVVKIEGIPIQATLYSAHHGNWGFLSNNLEAMQDALDRAAGRATTPSLADNPKFKDTTSQLLPQPDFLFFLQPQPVLEALLSIGEMVKAQPIPSQVDAVRKIEGVGLSLKLDGANMHDRVFILSQNPPDHGSLTHSGINVTSSQTTAFFDFVTKFEDLGKPEASPILTALVAKYLPQDPQTLAHLQAFGPEMALSVFWPEGNLKPEAFMALQIKDPAKAAEAIQSITTYFPDVTVTADDGQTYYNFPLLNRFFYQPTATLTKGFLLIGLNPDDTKRAVKAERKGETLDKSSAFASALPTYHAAGQAFGYIDSKQIFERIYPMIRQMMMFSAALTGGSDTIDASKLPKTETVAKHLQPIVFSQTRASNGYLLDSSGPITLNQAIIMGVTGGKFFMGPDGP